MYLDETTFNDGASDNGLEQQRDRSFGVIACFIEYPPASSVVVVIFLPPSFYLACLLFFLSCASGFISTHQSFVFLLLGLST